jgi:predicted naringenin-chalcone synthase
MDQKVYLHQISTQVPENEYAQQEILGFLLEVDSYSEIQRQFLKTIFQGSAIDKRYSIIEDYRKKQNEFTFFAGTRSSPVEPSLAKRNALFITEANRLALLAVNKLLAKLPAFDPQKITHLITVSCTGFSAPGFDFYLAKTLNLNQDLHRFHIGFMGCYAAFPALKMAHAICQAQPGARVLVVNVELCTIHLQLTSDRDMMVGNALFADGITAALVSACPEDNEGNPDKNYFLLQSFIAKYIDDSEEAMTWEIGERAFDMRLSAYVPRLIERNINPVVDELLLKAGVTRDSIKLWAIHPGGVSILRKVEPALQIRADDLADSYAVLREYGNMSSATIMFVLERILANKTSGPLFAAAFGPGLTVESACLQKIVC